MELKIWCEGLPRVICGVTEATTCQDVVVALAQAMGKTGRYTLVEKWRETERLIAPDECPLLCLHKWGEYANDVQFILRHNTRTRPGSADTTHPSRADSKRTSKLSYQNFTPHFSESRSSSTSSLRKSLTFSGAHSHSTLVPKLNQITGTRRDRQPIRVHDSSLESLTEQSSQSSQHSNFANSSAHSSLEPRSRGHHRSRLQDSISSQSSASSLDHSRNKSSVLSNRPGVPPSGSGQYKYANANGSLDRTRKRNRGGVDTSQKLSTSSSSSLSHSLSSPPPLPSSSSPRFPPNQPNGHVQPPSRERPSPPNLSTFPKESNNNIDYKPNANLSMNQSALTSGVEAVPGDGRRSGITEAEKEEKRSEMIKVVNMQMEKIRRQEEQMADIQTEITLKEGSLSEWDREDARTTEELSSLERREAELDAEIQDLELVSWQDKLEMEQEKEQRIQAEIQNLREKIQNCESEVSRQEELIKKLTTEAEKEKLEHDKEQQKEREEEDKVRQELSDLQQQMTNKRLVQETQQSSIDGVQTEVKDIERQIQERSILIEDLERELKDSNMERFSRSPGDWLRASQEGTTVTAFNRPSTNRPGSGRRLESPQRLKETAVSAKNPHGLWV